MDELARGWMRHMRRGDFAAACAISDEVRRRCPPESTWSLPRHQQSIWRGEALVGKRVLVRCYHGLGDTVQFVRFMPALREVAGSTVLWAQPALIPLLRSAPGIDELVPLTDGAPPVDYEVDLELMEVPCALRATLDRVPRRVPYLRAPRARLHPGGGLRVGVVWRVGDWDARRNLPAELVARWTRTPGTRWYVLQPEVEPAPPLARQLHVDVAGMAAVMRTVDLVITVDTLAAHLAGALAVPVWTLLHADPDWRWMEDRQDSPWYPTMRLFRQRVPGDWSEVAEAVQAALDAGVARPRP